MLVWAELARTLSVGGTASEEPQTALEALQLHSTAPLCQNSKLVTELLQGVHWSRKSRTIL